jgi:glyceraldehyde-3-phosphate dehydrogenase (NADP+)
VRECVLGALSYNGQRCTAIKIIFVPPGHRGRVLRAVQPRRRRADRRHALGGRRQITPLPEDGKPGWLAGARRRRRAGGAQVINAGGGTSTTRCSIPAVLYPCDADMEICQVEQFGPVVPIVPYDDEREVLDWVVARPVGQQAALFGSDPQRLSRPDRRRWSTRSAA